MEDGMAHLGAGEHLLTQLEVSLDDGVRGKGLRKSVERLAELLQHRHRHASRHDVRCLHCRHKRVLSSRKEREGKAEERYEAI